MQRRENSERRDRREGAQHPQLLRPQSTPVLQAEGGVTSSRQATLFSKKVLGSQALQSPSSPWPCSSPAPASSHALSAGASVLIPSSPHAEPARASPTDAGGLCWGHFKPVFSLWSLVVRSISSPAPSQLALRSARGGGGSFCLEGLWKSGDQVKRGGASLAWTVLRGARSPWFIQASRRPQRQPPGTHRCPAQGPGAGAQEPLSLPASLSPGPSSGLADARCMRSPELACELAGLAVYSILQLNLRSNISLTTLSGQRLIMAYI